MLAPSILSFDLPNLVGVVETMDSSGAPILHLDVMDGRFVPPITFGDAFVAALRPHSKAIFEAHLMVDSPESQFEAFTRAGCNRILFHVEATRHAYRLAQSLRELGVSPGIALNPGTPIEAALDCLEVVDQVLIMTVNPGWGGQSFLPAMLQKVSRLRSIAGPNLRIEVDGGMDRATILDAKAAGADTFVVGSHLAKATDLRAELAEMQKRCT